MNGIPIPKIRIPKSVKKFIKDNVGSFILDRLGAIVDKAIENRLFDEKEEQKEFEKQVRNASVQLEVQNCEAAIYQAMRVYEATLHILQDIVKTHNGFINIQIYGDVNIYLYNTGKVVVKNGIDSILVYKIIDDIISKFYYIDPQKEHIGSKLGITDTSSNNYTENDVNITMKERSNKKWKEKMDMAARLRSED